MVSIGSSAIIPTGTLEGPAGHTGPTGATGPAGGGPLGGEGASGATGTYVLYGANEIDDETGEIKAKDNFHRRVIHPGDDYSNEPDDVKVVADAVWTDEIIQKMADFRAAEIRD